MDENLGKMKKIERKLAKSFKKRRFAQLSLSFLGGTERVGEDECGGGFVFIGQEGFRLTSMNLTLMPINLDLMSMSFVLVRMNLILMPRGLLVWARGR